MISSSLLTSATSRGDILTSLGERQQRSLLLRHRRPIAIFEVRPADWLACKRHQRKLSRAPHKLARKEHFRRVEIPEAAGLRKFNAERRRRRSAEVLRFWRGAAS